MPLFQELNLGLSKGMQNDTLTLDVFLHKNIYPMNYLDMSELWSTPVNPTNPVPKYRHSTTTYSSKKYI